MNTKGIVWIVLEDAGRVVNGWKPTRRVSHGSQSLYLELLGLIGLLQVLLTHLAGKLSLQLLLL
jgi:hypothetical protein